MCEVLCYGLAIYFSRGKLGKKYPFRKQKICAFIVDTTPIVEYLLTYFHIKLNLSPPVVTGVMDIILPVDKAQILFGDQDKEY